MSGVSSSVKILGFDPGRDKCGLAVVTENRETLFHSVVAAPKAIATIESLRQEFPIQLLVMGNQTTALQWQRQLELSLSPSLPITLVDERYSTLEARDRFWMMYPPQGLMRLVPKGMREVPRPIDDIVAIILIERYLEQKSIQK